MQIPGDAVLLRMHQQGAPCFVCDGAGMYHPADDPEGAADICPACRRLQQLIEGERSTAPLPDYGDGIPF